MLKLINIKKDYVGKNLPTVHALKGVTISFRRNEFVAILGPSGCGKTTLLNIIGGLDSYTDGDLLIEGKSTKEYSSRDWDTYRNHSIGFVFQSYNLIPHQTLLANVELALTISGISKAERKKKAKAALKKVGLEGLENKKPNMLSGGQMQRVAIARALVNNPEVLLADEPTGALDTKTSIQVMDILKEIAKDRLVIMVTHNPELAHQYASRIVTMKDGLMTDDSNPYSGETKEELEAVTQKREKIKRKKLSSMSFWTAISLSLNNLMTKKGRTFLTSFAGSIGIIGIALILSVSYGTNQYVGRVQQDALTKYPMSVSQSSVDTSSLINSVIGTITKPKGPEFPTGETISENNTLSSLASNVVNSQVINNLQYLKEYLDNPAIKEKYSSALTSIAYSYNTTLTTYTNFTNIGDTTIAKAYPVTLATTDPMTDYSDAIKDVSPFIKTSLLEVIKVVSTYLNKNFSNNTFPTFCELIPTIDGAREQEYAKIVDEQYDLLKGKMPTKSNEVVIITDTYNRIPDYILYGLGLKNTKNLILNMVKSIGPTYSIPEDELNKIHLYTENSHFVNKNNQFEVTFDDILKLQYYLPLGYQQYTGPYASVEKGCEGNYYYKQASAKTMADYLRNSYDNEEAAIQNDGEYVMNLKVVGIVRAKKGVTAQCLTGGVGYLPSLSNDYLVKKNCSLDSNGRYIYPKSGIFKAPIDSKPENEKNVFGAFIKQLALEANIRVDVLTGRPCYVDGAVPVTNSDTIYGLSSIRKFILQFIPEEYLKFTDPEVQKAVDTFLAKNLMLSLYGTKLQEKSLTLTLDDDSQVTSGTAESKNIVEIIEQYPTIFGTMPDELKQRLILAFGNEYFDVGALSYGGTTVGTVLYQSKSQHSSLGVDGLVFLDPNNTEMMAHFKPTGTGEYMCKSSYSYITKLTNSKANTPATLLKFFGICDIANPKAVYFYPKTFDDKEKVNQLVNEYNKDIEAKVRADYKKYNDGVEPKNDKEKQLVVDRYVVHVNDAVGTLFASVSTIINSVTYVLIAFVAISLIVSSVMIAIITYISVIERTKEIGILRSIGARKIDISSVFNAETLIIGAISGLLGIGIAALLDIPIALIITALSGVVIQIALPWYGIVFLPLISIALTVISGFVPSIKAAKKDPVIALRTE